MVNNSEKEDDNELVICEMNKAMHKLGIKEGTLLKCINDHHLSVLHFEPSPFMGDLGSLKFKNIETDDENQYLMFLGIEQIGPVRLGTSYPGTPFSKMAAVLQDNLNNYISHPYVIKFLHGEEIVYLLVKPNSFLSILCDHFEIPGEE